ncbi:hypothetical protein ppKF707_4011 [Metapseudomonas furukawaii]|uniref:Uncharacterized protein n=1 Tax=Metapseudomonas furukawaii TaxID=1149133 RepID=A0AAD1FF24_METFU|nr:hypothetical protein ppKF707_4011 [Pseudomonas furukawaii]BAU73796.1 hypothetical protein KF707C_21080 [Pseudomonas furukawaii]
MRSSPASAPGGPWPWGTGWARGPARVTEPTRWTGARWPIRLDGDRRRAASTLSTATRGCLSPGG